MSGTVAKLLNPTFNSTANTTSYTSTSFTPTAGKGLCVVVFASGSVATNATLSGSANGMTFTALDNQIQTLSGHIGYIFASDQAVPASPSAMTVTFSCPSDAATGCFIQVVEVSGLQGYGASMIAQPVAKAQGNAGDAFSVTFGSAPNTDNPQMGFVAISSGGQPETPPTGWTELDEPADQSAPVVGFEIAAVNSGDTSTTKTWTQTAGGSPGTNNRSVVMAVEFNTIAAGGGGGGTVDSWGMVPI